MMMALMALVMMLVMFVFFMKLMLCCDGSKEVKKKACVEEL